MNTNKLESFAQAARIKLIDLISRKLDFVLNNTSQSFIDTYASQLSSLNDKIKQTSREQVIETVAYTWFNRFMALRFMDANGYTLPKVITPLPGMSNPEILQNALAGHIETDMHLDRQRLNDLLDGRTASADAHTEAYKMLIVAACNQWYTAMPFMFERISDYTELLLPDDLLSDYSIVADIRNGMTDEDCQQEEIIGWLYQFYISDKKDQVFKALSKNVKITAENIPAATQLFTPRWIVRYMVENTLGKLWLTFKPNSKLRDHMPYYIETPEGNTPSPLPEGIKGITDITFLDPCQGSGHVLVYAFDLFAKIYEEEGYNTNEIPALILQNNLFGIDIDPRAAQLAAFALTMKARNYYSRFLRKPIQPNVIALENVSLETIEQSINLPINVEGKKIDNYSDLSLNLLTQANNLGSLIQHKQEEVNAIKIQEGSMWQEQQIILKQQAEFLSTKYHCVVTNPPYMGGKGMNVELKIFVENNFKRGKSDLMACFMERCLNYNPTNGKTGMINQHSWMFLSSYEELRPFLIENAQFESMLHLGARTFPEIGGEVVQNAAFVLGNYKPIDKGVFIRLTDFGNAQLKDDKTLEAIQKPDCGWFYTAYQNGFEKIPGSPIGYWAKQGVLKSLDNIPLESIAVFKEGLTTANNDLFLRQWYEVSNSNITLPEKINNNFSKWIPYNKGGSFRKWYGNRFFVVNWSDNGNEIRKYPGSSFRNAKYQLKEGGTFSALSSQLLSARYSESGFAFDSKGTMFFSDNDLKTVIAFLNSKVCSEMLLLVCPTLDFRFGTIQKLPYLMTKKIVIDALIQLSKVEWDSRESSWDFQQNELIKQQTEYLKTAFESYKKEWSDKFYKLHRNEEELNRQFIEIYGLQDELTPDVPLEEITILQEEGKIVDGQLEIQTPPVMLQLISYAVGCMFGRYSLDKPGLILANQGDTVADFVRIVDSGQWSVVSKETETMTSHWALATSHYNKNSNESEQLQRFDSVAESDGLGGAGLSGYATVSEGGNVCTHKPTAKSSGVCAVEHSRGASTSIDSGVSPLSVDSAGIIGRGGNTADSGRAPELPNCGKPEHNNATSPGSEQNDSCTHAETPNWSLTTKHLPLSFLPDEDNIIPVLEGEWFSDDIVGRFREFTKVAFSAEQLNENIGFIEDNIPAKDIRKYFVKDFYNDHIKRYKKRPIYWMFSSPKGHFKALIYMHRYQPDTCSVLLNDYLQPFISKLESAKQTQTMLSLREDQSPRDKVAASKEIDTLQKMIDDCKTYERTLFTLATQKISMDLDDGVKVNYQKFKEVLVPIKGLEKEEE